MDALSNIDALCKAAQSLSLQQAAPAGKPKKKAAAKLTVHKGRVDTSNKYSENPKVKSLKKIQFLIKCKVAMSRNLESRRKILTDYILQILTGCQNESSTDGETKLKIDKETDLQELYKLPVDY